MPLINLPKEYPAASHLTFTKLRLEEVSNSPEDKQLLHLGVEVLTPEAD